MRQTFLNTQLTRNLFFLLQVDTKYWRAYFKKDRYYCAVEVGGPVTYRGLENSTKMNKRNGNIDLNSLLNHQSFHISLQRNVNTSK